MDKFDCTFISVTGDVLDNAILDTKEEVASLIDTYKSKAIDFRDTLHADVVLYAAENEEARKIYLYLTPLSMYAYRSLVARAGDKIKLYAAMKERKYVEE